MAAMLNDEQSAVLTEKEILYLKSFLDAGDRVGFYMAYYAMVGTDDSILSASDVGKDEASLQSKIASFSGLVGAAAYLSNRLLQEKLGPEYKGIYWLSQQVALAAAAAMEQSSSGFISDDEMFRSARTAWEREDLLEYFPGLLLEDGLTESMVRTAAVVADILKEFGSRDELPTRASVLDWIFNGIDVPAEGGRVVKVGERVAAVAGLYAYLNGLSGKTINGADSGVTVTPDSEQKLLIGSDGKVSAVQLSGVAAASSGASMFENVAAMNDVVLQGALLVGPLWLRMSIGTVIEALQAVLSPVFTPLLPDNWLALNYPEGEGEPAYNTPSSPPAHPHSKEPSSGDETLSGSTSNLVFADDDTIDAGEGDDAIFGGAGQDTLRGGSGDDIIWGQEGNDHLYGGTGDDVLRGGKGDDILSPGGGFDFLAGGVGTDQIDLNLGARTAGVDINVRVAKGGRSGEQAMIEILDSAVTSDRVLAVDVEKLVLTSFNDRVTLTHLGPFVLCGTEPGPSNQLANLKIDFGATRVPAFDDDIIDVASMPTEVALGSMTGKAGVRIDLRNAKDQTVQYIAKFSGKPPIHSAVLARFENANGVIGTDEDDELIGQSGRVGSGEGYSTLYGGKGNDFLAGRGWESHLYGGAGADQFEVGANTFVEDAEGGGGDKISYLGIPLYGGTKQWWMEGNTAYWSPFSTLMTAFPVIGSEILGAASFFVDAVTMKFATYRMDAHGALQVNFGWGHAGQAAVRNYNLDLDTGRGSGGIAAFVARGASDGASRTGASHSRFRAFVNLALKAGFGVDLNGMDPLVLDLNGDGFNLTTEANSKTYFEFDSDGFAEHTGWVKETDGLLVRDVNANGKIDNITELFGNRSTAGFAMLAGLDSNLDGIMNAADTVFAELQVWQDRNQDGISDAGELKTLAEMGIVSISLAYTAPAQPKDVAGHTIVHEGQFTWADGSLGSIGDVAFDISDTNTRWMGDATVSASAAALPQLAGFGEVKDLRVAMTGDAALEAQVSAFVANPTNDLNVLKTDAEAILYRWAGVQGAAATALGGNGFDTRKLAFLEKYSGVALMPRDASGAIVLDNIGEMEALWKDQVTRLTLRLVVQGPLADVFAGVTYNADRDLLVAAGPTALADLLHNLLVDLPADPVAAQAQWADWAPLLGAVAEGMVRHDANVVRDDFLFAQLVSAMDGAAQPLSLDQLVSALGIPNVRIGTSAAETLVRGAAEGTAIYYAAGGNDNLNGGTGQDAYVFGRTIGHVTINDIEAKPTGDRIRFAFLAADQVSMKRDGNDLLITVTGTAETVRVIGQFAPVTALSSDVLLSSNKGVEDIQFADGTVMETPEIMAAVGKGTAGDDHMIGTMHSDVFLGGLGNDRLEGGDDADLYVINAGEGQDVISDVQTTPLLRAADMLVFGDDIAPEDLVFARVGVDLNDLRITVGTTGQSVTIENQFDYSVLGYNAKLDTNSRIEAFAFRHYADGWSNKDLQQKLISDASTDGNDQVLGFGDDDLFASSAGNDLLIGLDGADTYQFGRGSGNDTIEERALYIDVSVGMGGLATGGRDDTVEFGAGLTAADLTFSRPSRAPDLVITIKATGETMTVRNQFAGFQTGPLSAQWFDRVEWFTFEDGTRLSWQDVLLDVTTGEDGDDVLTGDLSKDRLEGKGGNDLLAGLGLGDTYVYKLGYGHDTIADGNNSFLGAGFVTLDTDADVLELGPNITLASTSFSRSGDDITLSFGGSDRVTLKGQNDYFHSGVFGILSTNRVEEVRFSDGSIISWQDVNQRTIAAATSSGNDITEGFRLEDRFVASAGNDVLAGADSADTYEFGYGSGHDIIRESVSNVLYGDEDVVEFGAGVLPSDVLVSRSGDTLILTLASTGETLTIENEFAFSAWFTWTDVELFRFADGTQWTKEDLQVRLLQSTAGNDHLEAFDSNDILDGGSAMTFLLAVMVPTITSLGAVTAKTLCVSSTATRT